MSRLEKLITIVLIAAMSSFAVSALAGPKEDQMAFAKYFQEKFPKTDPSDFINGVYSINTDSREQWQEIEEFPPYEIAVEEGEGLFNAKFTNGKSYADCFADGAAARKNYPYFDIKRSQVVTLELAINECRATNKEAALQYMVDDMANISAYMAFTARGETIQVSIPNEAAAQAYEQGKEYYYSKRGQLNFACIDCHGASAGMKIRADTMSPSLGHTSHFPVYRFGWNSMGTLHRRFASCNVQVRAKPLAAQSVEYRNLEYFLSYMGNGLEINGPGTRK
ncbi:MAG: sulfur-oxidizing protein SoxA [Arenicella sp.]|jgi:sulfur-oxidizing protein SoxA